MDEKAKILIVEDERIIALEMRRKLESMGYDVSAIVSSGEEAVRKAEELHPDLVLMDIILQGEMDGVEAAGQIHARFDIPVVYVTANVSDARLEDITCSEPFGCLFKPFEDMELQAAVKMALYKYKMGKELKKSEERFKHLVKNSNDMIVILDENGKETYISDSVEHITGFSPEEVLNHSGFGFLHPDDVDHMSKSLSKLLKLPGGTIQAEYRHRRKDGSWLHLEAIGTNYLHKPSIKGIILNIRDITDRKQAEKALRDSEKNYRTLAETINDVTFVLDLEGKFTYVSPAVEKLTDYSWQDFLGRPSTEFIAPEYVESTVDRFKKGLAGKDLSLYEIEIIHKDGGPVPVELNVASLQDVTGNTTGRIGVARDITDRKQAGEALRESEERYRAIIEGMEDGYYEGDLSGRFTFFNEAMRRLANVPAEVLMGMSDLEYTSPETAKKIYKTFNKVYRTGKPADVEDYEIIRTDGSKRTLEFNVSLIRDDKEEPVGFRGIVRDATKRKAMEKELERRFQYLEGVLAAAPYAIIALDRYHQVVRWNRGAEKLFGYSQEEVIGRELDSLIAGTADTLEEAKTATKTLMDGKALSPWETVRFRKDGSPVNIIASGSPIMVADELVGVVAIYADIAARKQAEEEIKSHREHLALINQILRHDLTNDLVVIQSAINLYNKSPEDEFLEEISSRTKKSIELINSMRELETFISRHRELQIHDMRDTIDEVIKNYPSIDFDIKGKARVMADDSIASVIDNIIRNAVIHGKADKITITTGKERNMCEVRIADNGTGIPDDIKKKIFEEGFKYGDTGHTGIGLHIVEKAMESYGGYTWIEDNDPKGATFVLRFRMVK